MIRVPRFSHGRSMDASESYETMWHPLEWFIRICRAYSRNIITIATDDGAGAAASRQ
jgi:hypothetical protein